MPFLASLGIAAIALSALLPLSTLAQEKQPDAAKPPTADAPASSASQSRQPGKPGQGAAPGGRKRGAAGDAEGDTAKADKNAYDYHLPGADGKDIPLSDYKGKYILLVNLARKSSYVDQLPALIKLNDSYKEKGFVVIGVPSNEFGAAEPGTNAEIQKAYADAKVDFLITAVSKITGDDELPLFEYLTTGKSAPAGGAVAWNYTKFIIDKRGNVIARFDPDVTPDSAEMQATINEILEGTYKPKRAGAAGGRSPAGDSGPE